MSKSTGTSSANPRLIIIVNKMIMNWEMSHIDLLQVQILIWERAGHLIYHYLCVICGFQSDCKWKSLNKEVVFES